MIISCSGRIGSGKDTVGKIIQYLTDHHKAGYRSPNTEWDFNSYTKNNHDLKCKWEIKKFANKLKDIVCLLTGCTREKLEDHDFKNTPLGEDWIRYGYANGFYKEYYHNGEVKTMMHNEECSKDRYLQEYRTNWQTAYKHEYTPRELLQIIGTELFRNQILNNIWVNSLFNDYISNNIKAEKLLGDKSTEINLKSENDLPNWIITDMRFPNELKAVKDRGGITIRVNRFKEGDKVYWTDPDTTEFPEGASSGVYSIIKIYDEFCLLSNDVGSETEVPYDEIKLYIEDEHESETALDNAEFDYVIDNNGTIEELIEKVREILIKEKII